MKDYDPHQFYKKAEKLLLPGPQYWIDYVWHAETLDVQTVETYLRNRNTIAIVSDALFEKPEKLKRYLVHHHNFHGEVTSDSGRRKVMYVLFELAKTIDSPLEVKHVQHMISSDPA